MFSKANVYMINSLLKKKELREEGSHGNTITTLYTEENLYKTK